MQQQRQHDGNGDGRHDGDMTVMQWQRRQRRWKLQWCGHGNGDDGQHNGNKTARAMALDGAAAMEGKTAMDGSDGNGQCNCDGNGVGAALGIAVGNAVCGAVVFSVL